MRYAEFSFPHTSIVNVWEDETAVKKNAALLGMVDMSLFYIQQCNIFGKRDVFSRVRSRKGNYIYLARVISHYL